MPLQLDKVHQYESRGGVTRIVKKDTALLLSGPTGGSAQICIQSGRTYGAGGAVIKTADLPPWFWDEVDKCTPAALASTGFKEKRPRAPVQQPQARVGG